MGQTQGRPTEGGCTPAALRKAAAQGGLLSDLILRRAAVVSTLVPDGPAVQLALVCTGDNTMQWLSYFPGGEGQEFKDFPVHGGDAGPLLPLVRACAEEGVLDLKDLASALRLEAPPLSAVLGTLLNARSEPYASVLLVLVEVPEEASAADVGLGD